MIPLSPQLVPGCCVSGLAADAAVITAAVEVTSLDTAAGGRFLGPGMLLPPSLLLLLGAAVSSDAPDSLGTTVCLFTSQLLSDHGDMQHQRQLVDFLQCTKMWPKFR
jgi:hypothetical protein